MSTANVALQQTTQLQQTETASYYDGSTLGSIGTYLLAFIITVFTLGICYPWAVCIKYKFDIEHTVIEGKRLKFNGTAAGLFGNWIKWFLLCIITFGVYAFWLSKALKKWKVRNTSFQ
jgi:uncharacterized membrane protein YjgN (DUF898 family)